MILYEKVKKMTVDEMAKFLTELQCEECGYNDGDWHFCKQYGCWCHYFYQYETYKKRLESEV